MPERVAVDEIRDYGAGLLAQWIESTTNTLSDGRKHRIRTLGAVTDGEFDISLDAHAKLDRPVRTFHVGVNVSETTEAAAEAPAKPAELDLTAILSMDSTKPFREEIAALQQQLGEERARHAAELAEVKRSVAVELAAKKSELELDFVKNKRHEAEQTAARSRIALVAKIAEHFAPLLGGFNYNFKDCRHVGELFDFLVFDGLEEGEIRNVVFLEVKSRRSGTRVTNPRERLLKQAIEEGRVRYEVYVPPVDGAKRD
jgi:predicted Holliday junction resolvase-like endonuclease